MCIVLTQFDDLIATLFITTVILSISGIQQSGAFLNINELCPSFAAAGFAIAGSCANISGLALIQGSGLALNEWGNTQTTWNWMFALFGVYNIVGSLFAWLFTEGDVQHWAKSSKNEKHLKQPLMTDN